MNILSKSSLFLFSFSLIACGKKNNESQKTPVQFNYSHSKSLAAKNYDIQVKGLFTDQCQASEKNITWIFNSRTELSKQFSYHLKKVDDCKFIIHEAKIIDKNSQQEIYNLKETLEIEIHDSNSNDDTELQKNYINMKNLKMRLSYIDNNCKIEITDMASFTADTDWGSESFHENSL